MGRFTTSGWGGGLGALRKFLTAGLYRLSAANDPNHEEKDGEYQENMN
jgi:hypothetical protein